MAALGRRLPLKRTSPLGAWFFCGCLGLCGAAAPAQAPAPPPFDPDVEGSLSNDTFVAFSQVAAEALRLGDERYARARRNGLDETLFAQASDAWHTALRETEVGDTVPLETEEPLWPDPDATHDRRTEAVEYAVMRRVRAAGPEAGALWTARMEELAAVAFDAAGPSHEALLRVERDHPATPSACRAGLALFELELERGRQAFAQGWLDRADRQLDACTGLAEEVRTRLADAVGRRREALRRLLGPAAGVRTPNIRSQKEETWSSARSLRLRDTHVVAARPPVAHVDDHGPARGLIPSLTFLPEGSLLVRTRDVGMFFTPEGAMRPFLPGEIASELALQIRPAYVTGAGSWRLDAAASEGPEGALVHFAVGRAMGSRGNMLLALGVPARGQAPQLQWVLCDQGSRGREAPAALEALGGGRWEFQPGAVVLGDTLFVQARRWALSEAREQEITDPEVAAFLRGQGLLETQRVDEGQAEAWLLALSTRTAELRWKRLLGRGADLQSGAGGRFGPQTGLTAGAQPLTLSPAGLFVPTGLGVAALVEVQDGRVAWTLKTRRRRLADAGWSGSSPAPVTAAGVLYAPYDSDRVYTLRAEPDLASEGLFLEPPRPIGEALELLHADADHAWVLSRSGARRALSRWAREGGRLDAFYLPRNERFSGAGLGSSRRSYFATTHALYVVDAERLYLLDRQPLDAPAGRRPELARGGSVYARGDEVYVLGETILWVFEARTQPR